LGTETRRAAEGTVALAALGLPGFVAVHTGLSDTLALLAIFQLALSVAPQTTATASTMDCW
jgi:hypothetical protein